MFLLKAGDEVVGTDPLTYYSLMFALRVCVCVFVYVCLCVFEFDSESLLSSDVNVNEKTSA